MARGDFPSSKQDQYMVRFPDGMRDRLKNAAKLNLRSMNAEIIERLDWTFDRATAEMSDLLDRAEAAEARASEAERLEQHWRKEFDVLRGEADRLRANAASERSFEKSQNAERTISQQLEYLHQVVESQHQALVGMFEKWMGSEKAADDVRQITQFIEADNLIWEETHILDAVDIKVPKPEIESDLAIRLMEAVNRRTEIAGRATYDAIAELERLEGRPVTEIEGIKEAAADPRNLKRA